MKEISDRKRIEVIDDLITSRASELSKEEIIFGVLQAISGEAVCKKQLVLNINAIINVYRKYFKGLEDEKNR